MLIQVYSKNEPLSNCDLLIAREDATLSIPASSLAGIMERSMRIVLVKPQENIGMKAAVVIADAIKNAEAISSPVHILCPDKAIMDGICSVDYEGPAGGVIKCAPDGTKPASPKVRNLAKSGPSAKKAASAKTPDDPEKKAGEPAAPEQNASGSADGPGNDDKDDATMEELLKDPAFVDGDEMSVPEEAPKDSPTAPDPAVTNTPKIMAILKEQGVPSGHIPGVLEALREAMDANITLPMQIKLKLARDQAADGLESEKTAELVKPRFDELKALLKEIDGANAAKA